MAYLQTFFSSLFPLKIVACVQTGPERFQNGGGRKLKELRICFGRLTRILARLPALRLMNSSITEELFFTGLIGNVSIDSIIPYILKMETAEYNSQDSDPTG